MNKINLLLIIIFSLIASALPLITIELIDGLRENKEAIFRALDLMIRQVQFAQIGFWDKLGQMRGVLWLMPLMYFGLLVVYIPILLLLYLLFSSKFRKPKIFISYKMSDPGEKYNTEKIASELDKNLTNAGYKVFFMNPKIRPKHDEVNEEVKKQLRWADAVVAVPHANKSSYLNAEIAIAYYLDKPVYLVKYTEDQQLPSNANTGHTVFLYSKLKKNKYNALFKVLSYAHRTWRSRWEKVFTPVFNAIDEISGSIWVMILIYAVSLIYLYFPLSVNVHYLSWGLNIVFVLVGTSIWFNIFYGILERSNFQKTIRQSIINEKPTYALFAEAEFEDDILQCIDQKGLHV